VTATPEAILEYGAIDPGESLLVVGLAMTAKRRLALELLARRVDHAAGVVPTRKNAATIRRGFGTLVDLADWTFRAVDCVSRPVAVGRVADTAEVSDASSAGDLTGIGMKLSGIMQAFYHDPDVDAAARFTGLFDGVIETRADPQRTPRVRGLDVGSATWTRF